MDLGLKFGPSFGMILTVLSDFSFRFTAVPYQSAMYFHLSVPLVAKGVHEIRSERLGSCATD